MDKQEQYTISLQRYQLLVDDNAHLREENKRLRNALEWFCKRVEMAGVRSHLTYAVFMMLLSENEAKRLSWLILAETTARRRKESGYPELDWNWRLDKEE